MSNPVFNNSAVFGDPRARGTKGARQQQAPSPYMTGTATTAGPVVEAATLEQMYGAPTATTRDTGRLTYDDVIMKTGGLLALLVVVAAVTWNTAPQLYFVGAIVGLVLGLVNSFKKNPSPPLIIAYTVAEGVFLGGISYLFQNVEVINVNAQPLVL
ncbi:MAG TPA: Bax inhibitor-1/YccA family protein, partial [Cellulomonas sp.]